MVARLPIFIAWFFITFFAAPLPHLRASSSDSSPSEAPSVPGDATSRLKRLLSDTSFPKGLPAESTILCLDFSGFPSEYFSTKGQSLETIRKYLSSSLLQDSKGTYFSEDSSTPAAGYEKWVLYKNRGFDEKEKVQYHVLRLFSRRHNVGLESLMELADASVSSSRPFCHIATAIVFPIDEQKAMIYGFGTWSALINQRAIVPSWGLRLAASSQLCNPQKIKIVKAADYTREVPATLKITSSELTSIEALGLEVGSEGLEALGTLPRGAKCFKGMVIASDYFHFSFNAPSQGTLSASVFAQMRRLAVGLEEYQSSKTFLVHPQLLVFIDDEEKDEDRIGRLNTELVALIRRKKIGEDSEDGLRYIFTSPYVRRMFSQKDIYFHVGSGKKSRKKARMHQAISAKRDEDSFSLDTQLRLNVGGRTYDEPIRFIITSLPIPLPSLSGDRNEGYFRFDRGRWLRVDSSRFEKIKVLLRQSKISKEDLGLPEYTYKHATPPEPGGKSDGEKGYLQDCLTKLKDPASYLDCRYIQLGSSKDIFEFGDLLIEKEGQLYIIHAKRAKANALSHHREQVERTAHYLATNFGKEGSQGYFIDTTVKDFYREVRLSPTEKAINARQKELPKIKLEKEKSLKERALQNEGTRPKKRNAQQIIWDLNELLLADRKIDAFEDNQQDFVPVLMALRDWSVAKNVSLSSKDNKDKISTFLEKAKRALKLQKMLFSKGPLTKQIRKGVTFVLAVIDDRQVESFKNKDESIQAKEGTVYKKPEPLLRPQDLWGLDMTRTTVQKKGFGFKMLVINEHQTDDWDAFGKRLAATDTKKTVSDDDEESDATDNTSDDEPEEGSSPPPVDPVSKAKVKAKKEAAKTHNKDAGYIRVSDEVMLTEDGQKYLRVLIDGSTGDCCFHALGLKREEALRKMETYIDDCERRLLEAGTRARVGQGLRLRDVCNPLLTTSDTKDPNALKGHNFLSWKETTLREVKGHLGDDELRKVAVLSDAFDSLMAQQTNAEIDWGVVVANARSINGLVYKSTSDINELIDYKDFIEQYVNNLRKRVEVGDISLWQKIEEHLKIVEMLDDNGDKLRDITDKDLDFTGLKAAKRDELRDIERTRPRKVPLKQKKKQDVATLSSQISKLTALEVISSIKKDYIKYYFSFDSATPEYKKEILRDFYLTNREWLDPSAIMHLGSYFGFKAKLFKNVLKKGATSPTLCLNAQTPNTDMVDSLPCRLMVHVNDSHYDLLYPIDE